MGGTQTCLSQINVGMANFHSKYAIRDTCTTLNNRTATVSPSSTIVISKTWSCRSFNALNPRFAMLESLSTSRRNRQIHSSSCRPWLIRAEASWHTSSSPDGEEGSEDSSTSGQSLEQEVVTEVHLSGDSTEVREIGDSLYSFKTLKKLVFKLGDGGKQFVMDSVGGVVGIFKMGKKKDKAEEEGQSEMLAFTTSVWNTKDGISAVHQWTATELTMQHGQLVRIATDLNYLVFAFAFFGWVRVLEAVLKAFATNPPKLKKLTQCSNAMDPLTVAWLAYNLRKPILGILRVDPTDFQKVATLKGKLWEELHAFFERQWKVMATIAMVRFLGLTATHIPTSQWITSKVKLVWDILMALPIF